MTVLLIAYGGYIVISMAGSVIRPSWGCLPGDFPRYSHAAIAEMDQIFDSLPAGETMECRMRLGVADAFQDVYDFYYKRLAMGDWTFSSAGGSEQTGGATIAFNRLSRPQTHGSMTIHAQGRGTPFEVDLIS